GAREIEVRLLIECDAEGVAADCARDIGIFVGGVDQRLRRDAAANEVVGGGPGGYVAAIRAGQLGLDTILVEAERLGGTCLKVGCIPSKALIHAADAAHALSDPHAFNAIGLSIGAPKLDFAKTIAWKDSIVARLTGGV